MGECTDRGVIVGLVVALFAALFAYWFELGFLDHFCFVMVIIVVDVNGVVGRSQLSVIGRSSRFQREAAG